MFNRVGELLNETITSMAFDSKELYIDPSEIKNKETKKLFTKEGKLKGNINKAKELRKEFLQIIKDEGLSEYQPLRFINFAYGVMRHGNFGNPDNMKSFRTSENEIYYETDFDLEDRSNGMVEPITEVEYQEKYLEEVKKKQAS